MSIKDKVAAALPWIEPILDYFDWRKTVAAFLVTAALTLWSYAKELPAPVIAVLALATLIHVAYALAFPAFLRLVHVGVNPRPNYDIWRHKSQFALIQAACLLADREPNMNPVVLDGDAAAWFEVLSEAIQKGELDHISRPNAQRNGNPQLYTQIEATKLKRFCTRRGLKSRFLALLNDA